MQFWSPQEGHGITKEVRNDKKWILEENVDRNLGGIKKES